MVKKVSNKINILEVLSLDVTKWIGTPWSIFAHTILFVAIFALRFFGLTTDQILLVLTTAVSLEAIYLAIFIQMTVNRNTTSLESVEEDIEDIQEDVQGLEEDVDDISGDIDIIQSKNEDKLAEVSKRDITSVKKKLEKLQTDLATFKQKNNK